MDTTRQTIGQNIRKYRQQRGVKQKDLAAALGVNSSAVSNWETGVNSIDIEALVRISSLLDVSLDALYGGDAVLTIIHHFFKTSFHLCHNPIGNRACGETVPSSLHRNNL
ncbi:MAG: helix-turn-helix transcriptional regulator, partial [Clostridia bacterium]|nr:helix-turn-helix transcriptional regulator [Clostridia bacterium]